MGSLRCFSRKDSLFLNDYSETLKNPPGSFGRSDIETLLDHVAQGSPILNMPERQEDLWPHYRENLSKDDISILNEYRNKFGLKSI